jgi:hypothetical protein
MLDRRLGMCLFIKTGQELRAGQKCLGSHELRPTGDADPLLEPGFYFTFFSHIYHFL